jgi:molecular chaperone DnaK
MKIGIDLGTTFSLACYLNARGIPTLVPDAQFDTQFQTPSVIHISQGRATVGHMLEELLAQEPGLSNARGFKAQMGRNAPVYQDDKGQGWDAMALSALVLQKLARDTRLHCGEPITQALITIPANFDDTQRKATQLAATLAGIGQVTLVEEPIAAAAFHGFSERDQEQTLLVYDLGGGTFDATVLQISQGRLYVLATEGHNRLGGLGVDAALVQLLAERFERQQGLNPMADAAAAEALRRFAVQAKLELSQGRRTALRKAVVLGGRVGELGINLDQFEAVVQPVVAESLRVCESCLQAAALGWGQLDRILLVGGSSLLPQVGRALALASGQAASALLSRHPHQAVAYGAGLLAHAQGTWAPDGGSSPDAALQQTVAPYHLGLRVRDPATGRPTVQVLIKRNTPLPAQHTAVFYTSRADQTRLVFDVVQGKTEHDVQASLGRFIFGPLERPQRNYPVELTVGYDAQGLVRVQAKDLITLRSLQRDFSDSQDTDLAALSHARELLASLQRPGH